MVCGFLVTHPTHSKNSSGKIPIISVKIRGNSHKALLDSGASISILSQNLIDEKARIIPWTRGPIVLANDAQVIPIGSIIIRFSIGSTK